MKRQIKTKLDLTLCGMLPYNLQGEIIYQEDNVEKITLGYKDGKDNIVGINEWLNPSNPTHTILPYLHSFENLLLDDKSRHKNKYFKSLRNELNSILETEDCSDFICSVIDNTSVYISDVNKIREGLEWLKFNHFNLYNLEKSMYIEKFDKVKVVKGKIGDDVEIWDLDGLSANIEEITVNGYILSNKDGIIPGYFDDNDLCFNPFGEEGETIIGKE